MLQKIPQGFSAPSERIARALVLSLLLSHLTECSTVETVSADTISTAMTSNPTTTTFLTTSATTSAMTMTTSFTTPEDSTVTATVTTAASTATTTSSVTTTWTAAATSTAAASTTATSTSTTATETSVTTGYIDATTATTVVSSTVPPPGTSTSVIIGAVVGSVLGAAFVLVVILLAVHFTKKRRNKLQPPSLPDPFNLNTVRRHEKQQSTTALTESPADKPDEFDDLQIHQPVPAKSATVDMSRCRDSVYVNDAVLGDVRDTWLDSNGNKPQQDAMAVEGSFELDLPVPTPGEQRKQGTREPTQQHHYVNVAIPQQPVYVNINSGSNAAIR